MRGRNGVLVIIEKLHKESSEAPSFPNKLKNNYVMGMELGSGLWDCLIIGRTGSWAAGLFHNRSNSASGWLIVLR